MSEINDNAPTYTKIEIDEKSNEPVLVEVNAEKINNDNKIESSNAKKNKEHHIKPPRHAVQLSMKTVFNMATDKTISKRQRIFKVSITLLFIVFVVGVLIYTAYNDFAGNKNMVTWEEIVEIFTSSWQHFIFAVLALFMCFFSKGLKLSILCKSATGKFHFKTCMETGIIGHYYNTVTPLAVGGQPFEIFHLSKHGVTGGTAATLPVVTYFFNQLAFVILTIVALIFMKDNNFLITHVGSITGSIFTVMAIIGLALCLIVPVLILIFCIHPKMVAGLVSLVIKIGNKLRLIKKPKVTKYKILKNVIYNAKSIKKLSKKPFILMLSFLISLLEHVALCSIAYFTLKFFGLKMENTSFALEWVQILQICIILNATISFIPTPGNSGAADISFYELFSSAIAGGLAFPAMMTWRILGFYSFIIIGFLFTTAKTRIDKKLKAKNIQPT